MKETFKITLEEFRELYDENTSKRRYKEIKAAIDSRFNYIVRKISTKFEWWDYQSYDSDANGFFNEETFNEIDEISFDGDFFVPAPYDSSRIPIRWLWEDFEQEFKTEVENFKKEKERVRLKNKTLREQRKLLKESFKKTISQKLTKEELKYIKFK